MSTSYYRKRLLLVSCLAVLPVLMCSSSGRAQSNQKLSGVVTDPFGPVITTAVIRIYSADRVQNATSDQEGRFSFTNVSPGTYQIEAWAPGFKTKTIEFVQTGNADTQPLVIALAVASQGDCGGLPGAISYENSGGSGSLKLTVKVLDSKRPLAKAAVSLKNTLATESQLSQRTNKSGELHFGNLEPGQYVLTVSHRGYRVAQTKSFWITRENQTTVMLEMIKDGEIIICE